MGQRPNELTPHQNLQHYWGAELRTLRTAQGLSLAELGHRMHCDPSYLAKIERAERLISAPLAETCDQVLQAQGMLTRLHALVEHDQTATSSRQTPDYVAGDGVHVAGPAGNLADGATFLAAPDPADEVVVAARTSDGRVVFVSVSRRVVIQGLGAATVGLAVAPIPGSAATHHLPSFAAVGDVHPIEHFQRLRETLIENDALFGPRQVIPAVQEQLAIIQRLRLASRGTDQRELTRVQAQYTQFHSGLRNDTCEHELAESCVDRALGLSQLAEDRELTAYFLACKAELAGRTQVAVDAIGAADQALRMSAPRSRVAAAAAIFAGHGHALSGDHLAMERSYDQARDLLATSDNDPDCPCRLWWLDEGRIDLQRARSLAALGDYHRAAQSYQEALAKIPSRFRRGRGVWLACASRAFAGDHQIEHAATLGSQALALGTETCSARTLTELAHLNNELAPWRTVPAVADFRSAMQHTLVRQT